MIISKTLVPSLFKSSKTYCKIPITKIHNRALIGNRDWVGFGKTGCAYYDDDPRYPFPAVRFRENSNELFALKEKEKGDWRKLTIEEKKILYRASFCQTLSEVLAPTGNWKSIIGWGFFFISLGLWLFILEKIFIYPGLPETFSESHRRKIFRAMIVLRMGHLTGVSSKWDYERDDWKK